MSHKYKHINLIRDFKNFLARYALMKKEDHVLLAVSGGLDSVVMANLFHRTGLSFGIAHCNFGLRGLDSDADAQWVEKLAHQYSVSFHLQQLDIASYMQQKGCSTQMAARDLRYSWFSELCIEKGYDKVAIAHHADDRAETILFNLTKGTGIAGLHSILPQRGSFIRPLLFTHKSTLLTYAQANGLTWREDRSNDTDDYARNIIRHHVIPALQRINPELISTLNHTIERLSQVEALFKQSMDTWHRQIVSFRSEGMYFTITEIRYQPWVVVVCWEWLKPFGFNFTQVNSLFQSKNIAGKVIYSTNYQLVTDAAGWLVTKRSHLIETKEDLLLIPKHATNITTSLYVFHLRKLAATSYQIVPDRAVAALDEAKLAFPLTIRRWQRGDIFYPLGMRQRKKVSDFLIDRKVPLWAKEKVDVLCSNGIIAWIIGYQIDDYFKITPSTQHIYELKRIDNECLPATRN